MSIELFVGTWRLLDYRSQLADGRIAEPLGRDPFGVGVYTRDGRMSAHLMRCDRGGFGGRRPGDPALDPDLILAAAAGYIGYGGTYEVDPAAGVIAHHVDVAFAPDWVGTVMTRHYAFDGETLILRPPAANGIASELRWRRA